MRTTKNKTITKLDAVLSKRHSGSKDNRGSIDTILSTLFQNIMVDIGMNINRWNHLMVQYINDPNKCIPDNTKDKASARGNLQKELLKPRMSWQVFCKGLRFLNILKFKISITAYHARGNATVHDFVVDFGEHSMEEMEETKENDESTD